MLVSVLLDEIDLEILRFLSSNARLKYKQIGLKIGKPVSTIFKRVERLKKLGVIRGFTVVVDKYKLNYTISALGLLNINPKHLNEFINMLVKNPNILQVHYTALHDYNIVWFGVFRDVTELENLTDSLRTLDYVRDVKIIVLTKTIKDEVNPQF